MCDVWEDPDDEGGRVVSVGWVSVDEGGGLGGEEVVDRMRRGEWLECEFYRRAL